MPYINTTTQQYPITEQGIRNANPNTSFTDPFKAPDEYAWVFPAPAPAYDQITQYAREVTPILTVKGHYEQQWEIVDLDAETVATNQANAVKAANQRIYAEITLLEAKQPRAVREALLNMDGAVARLQTLEDQIAALRGQLQ